jgi:hypothetical protein
MFEFERSSNMTDIKTLIRASVQGIVYFVESATGRVYTYNPESPIYVGQLEKIPEEEKNMISKTNGCLAAARVKYRTDIREVMSEERKKVKTTLT